MFASRGFRLTSILASLVVVLSMASITDAEARRGGSFGSRGGRTFTPPAVTQTAPNPTAPVQRTMTPSQQQNTAAPTAQSAQPRGGFMNGFGGNLFRGLMLGGLFGLLLGTGFGGIGGVLALLAQVALVAGAIWLVMRFMRAPQPAAAGGPNNAAYRAERQPSQGNRTGGYGSAAPAAAARRPKQPNELNIGMEELEKFESMLTRVQAAFASENYAALRALTTPEVMGYLSEELATNATNGVKNEVTDVKLLQGDLAESWREGNDEYATVAMRYEAIDYMRDRTSGAVTEGDAETPTESTEIWTFKRTRGDKNWLLSAIQEA